MKNQKISIINPNLKEGLKVELFLDSGAFSAWSQRQRIDIYKYIKFIQENKDYIQVYANLDVIGNPKATWQNQMIMEDAGLHPLPIFHYGSEDKWLKRILDHGYDYIGIGIMQKSKNKLIPWLDHIFYDYLTDEQGRPVVKVHGFAVTSFELMTRYPWYSVDSTTWIRTSRMGSIIVPRSRGGKWVYNVEPFKIAVSDRSPQQKKIGKHISNLNPMEKRLILQYIHEKGYTLGRTEYRMVDQNHKLQENERWEEKRPKNKSQKRKLATILEPGITNKNELRDEMNIIYFLDLERSWPDVIPFKPKQYHYEKQRKKNH